MPHVATIDGVKIMFYSDDHPPPHFHAQFAEHMALIDIKELTVVRGYLPKPQLRKVLAWAMERQPALWQAWVACESGTDPGKIA
jgi:hypothetical protein